MAGAVAEFDFDAAIVGGGPAGLSAAVVLGRVRRNVALFDHGKPRNYAAHAVHCYLGLDGIEPGALRERGRREATSYGVKIFDRQVIAANCLPGMEAHQTGFEVRTVGESINVRALLLATGVVDDLPEIANLGSFYGRTVHRCPYCDGWEHRGQHLAALGTGDAAVNLALSLRTWSQHVTACTNGHALKEPDRERLKANGIAFREEAVNSLEGKEGALEKINFQSGPPLQCGALFFSAGQGQRSRLADMLGCQRNQKDQVETGKKQETEIEGLSFAGDADGEVQFAIVAAAEGAVAATAINALLQKQDLR